MYEVKSKIKIKYKKPGSSDEVIHSSEKVRVSQS
jgi:hypothetical protein